MSRRPHLAALAVAAGTAAFVAVPAVWSQAVCRNVAIRSPFGGSTVRGLVPVLGSARIDGFGFYKLESAPEAAPEAWSAVSTTHAQAVVNGTLDQWDTRVLADGAYRLKLTVVDASGQEPCKVLVERIVVANAVTVTAVPTVDWVAPAAASGPDAPAPGRTPGADAAAAETAAAVGAEGDGTTAGAEGDAAVGPAEGITTTESETDTVAAGEEAAGAAEAPGETTGAAEAPGETVGEADDGGIIGVLFELVDPRRWLTAPVVSGLPDAFLRGAGAAAGIALAAVVVWLVRRRR